MEKKADNATMRKEWIMLQEILGKVFIFKKNKIRLTS